MKSISLKRSELKAVSIPSSLPETIQVNSTLSLSSLLSPSKSTTSEKYTQHSIQLTDKSTDSSDLQKTKVNKKSNTDFIRLKEVGTNTEILSTIPLRSISTNTSTILMKSIGTETDDELIEKSLTEKTRNNLNIEIPIRCHTILENRNFKRQDTFTISTQTVKTSGKIDTECPAEKLLRSVSIKYFHFIGIDINDINV